MTEKKKIQYKGNSFWVQSRNALEESFWERYSNGNWESSNLDFLLKKVRQGHFLDIGSWIGPISILMSSHYEKVISIDFDTFANESFFGNIALNNIKNISHHAIGLGDGNSVMEIDADDLGQSTTTLFSDNSKNKLKVNVQKFDDFMANLPESKKISFIKIDCEGAEYLFLRQVYSYVKNSPGKVTVLVSYHPWVIKKPKYYLVKIMHWLRQLPFRRFYFTKSGELIEKGPFNPMFSLYERLPLADAFEKA